MGGQCLSGAFRCLPRLLRFPALLRQTGQILLQCGGLPLQQRQPLPVRQPGGALLQQRCPAGGFIGVLRGLGVLRCPGLLLQRLPLRRLLPQCGGLLLQLVQRVLRLPGLGFQCVQIPQRQLQVVYLPLQCGDQAGLVVLAAVQLLFQPLVGLGVGCVLLPCGD